MEKNEEGPLKDTNLLCALPPEQAFEHLKLLNYEDFVNTMVVIADSKDPKYLHLLRLGWNYMKESIPPPVIALKVYSISVKFLDDDENYSKTFIGIVVAKNKTFAHIAASYEVASFFVCTCSIGEWIKLLSIIKVKESHEAKPSGIYVDGKNRTFVSLFDTVFIMERMAGFALQKTIDVERFINRNIEGYLGCKEESGPFDTPLEELLNIAKEKEKGRKRKRKEE